MKTKFIPEFLRDAFGICDKPAYFATIKDYNTGQYLLLARARNDCPYRFVCQGEYAIKFKTPTSARNTAKAIERDGLQKLGYELGPEYKLGKSN